MAKTAANASENLRAAEANVIVIVRSGGGQGASAAARAALGARIQVLEVDEALSWRGAGAVSLVIVAAPLDDPAVEAATSAVGRGSEAPIYACIDEASLSATQAMLRLGVAELFQTGANGLPTGLTEALRRHAGADARKAARLHAVLGLRGGVGASALAIEYAFRTARQLNGPQVALVDLDFGLGRAAERLGLSPSWRPGHEVAGEAVLRDHWSGLHVASTPFLEPHYPCEELVIESIEQFAARADELVIDVPRGWPKLRDLVIAKADVLTIVTDASPTGLDVARRANLAMDTLFPAAKDVFVLVNQRRLPRDRHIPDNRIAETMLGYDRVMVLDEDRDAFARAAGLREPVHYVAPASPFVRSFSVYADAVRATRSPAPISAFG